MINELKNVFGNVFLTIQVDHQNQWIKASWKGYSTEDSIKIGMEAYTDVLEAEDYSGLLIDARAMLGTWNHALDWSLNKWAPQAALAGLTHYAMVVNPETFAESTADDFYAKVHSFEAEIFQDMPTAEAWLRQNILLSNPNNFQRL